MPPQARYEQHDDVGELVLDAPPLNLFGPAMFDDLSTAIAQAQQAKPRALVLRSDADAFSAGADVHVFSELDAESAQPFTERLLTFAHAVEDLPCPTLAIVGGLCLTAGLELSLACDLLWAGEGVQFGLVEAVVGITPLMGGTQRMAERAGSARAREFVMTGGLYDAETLERWGVVNRVVDDGTVHEKGLRFAERLAAGPTLAHAATKRIVREQIEGGVERADEVTPAQFAGLFASEDLQNAVRSFLTDGPGKATFEGR